MKKKAKKLGLHRETLAHLAPEALGLVAGQATYLNCPCQESILVCSEVHTCVSCVQSEDCG
ncbi:MAG TPA: class I lanthipeptide [Thermoanaerobaculia bacterium]|nr:class I lanthipeptide [Thermoanaerobaculia bacterium]